MSMKLVSACRNVCVLIAFARKRISSTARIIYKRAHPRPFAGSPCNLVRTCRIGMKLYWLNTSCTMLAFHHPALEFGYVGFLIRESLYLCCQPTFAHPYLLLLIIMVCLSDSKYNFFARSAKLPAHRVKIGNIIGNVIVALNSQRL